MDKKQIINEILKEYEIKRSIALEKQNIETEKAYRLCPSLKEIDEEINRTGFENMHKILSDRENAAKIKEEFFKVLNELKIKREKIIKDNGINPDYNRPVYECKKCNDTGFLENGERCSCFENEITKRFYKKSNMGKMIKDADFDNFSLDYYSDQKGPDGQSPKEIVEEALLYSKYFCDHFDDEIHNIYFYGDTGLGKTYLSTIIAKNLMNRGKIVVYIRATEFFSLYDEYKFKNYDLKEKIEELYKCDLLVIDDLGTEFTSKTGLSFLFDLFNERLINNKKIIINSNLDVSQFSKHYTVRLTSRIYENFKIFRFSGKDIRIEKLINRNK